MGNYANRALGEKSAVSTATQTVSALGKAAKAVSSTGIMLSKPMEFASGGSITQVATEAAHLNFFNRLRQNVVIKGLRVFESVFGHDKSIGTPLEHAIKGSNPLLLVGGFANTNKSWAAYANGFARDGFNVYVMSVPGNAMSDLRDGAKLVAEAVDKIRTTTGAQQVDLVGYSAGGLIIRTAARDFAAPGSIGFAGTLNTPNHGLFWKGVFNKLGRRFVHIGGGVSASQMISGSDFLKHLNDPSIKDKAGPGIRYASVYSNVSDLVVTPTNSAMLDWGKNIPIGNIGGEHNIMKIPMGPDHYTILHRSDAAFNALRDAILGAA